MHFFLFLNKQIYQRADGGFSTRNGLPLLAKMSTTVHGILAVSRTVESHVGIRWHNWWPIKNKNVSHLDTFLLVLWMCSKKLKKMTHPKWSEKKYHLTFWNGYYQAKGTANPGNVSFWQETINYDRALKIAVHWKQTKWPNMETVFLLLFTPSNSFPTCYYFSVMSCKRVIGHEMSFVSVVNETEKLSMQMTRTTNACQES